MIALHCLGSTGRQWQDLADRLGDRFATVTPDLIGTATQGHWCGERAFSPNEEAAPILRTLDKLGGAAHLVGHSYGEGWRYTSRQSGRSKLQVSLSMSPLPFNR